MKNLEGLMLRLYLFFFFTNVSAATPTHFWSEGTSIGRPTFAKQ
jgi:hypothetical protein